SRKRGIGHLTSVPDPDLVPSSDEHADEPCAAAGSVEEETGADLGDEGGSGTGPGNESPGGEEAARAICLRLRTTGPRTRDELATARRLVAKRVPASRGKPMPARARQLMGMLARKGYPAGLAAQVVREALEQEQENDAGYRSDLAWISEDGAGDDWL